VISQAFDVKDLYIIPKSLQNITINQDICTSSLNAHVGSRSLHNAQYEFGNEVM